MKTIKSGNKIIGIIFEEDIVMSDTVSELTVDDMAKHLIKILVDNMQPDPEVLAEAIWDLFMLVPFPSLEEMDCPRTCSHCGKGMHSGYCIEGGQAYYCSDECLHANMTQEEYLNLYDEGNGDSYYTEWEDEDSE